MFDEKLFAGFTPKEVRHLQYLRRHGPADWKLGIGRLALIVSVGLLMASLPSLFWGHFPLAFFNLAVLTWSMGAMEIREVRFQQTLVRLIRNTEQPLLIPNAEKSE